VLDGQDSYEKSNIIFSGWGLLPGQPAKFYVRSSVISAYIMLVWNNLQKAVDWRSPLSMRDSYNSIFSNKYFKINGIKNIDTECEHSVIVSYVWMIEVRGLPKRSFRLYYDIWRKT
jgi:hypothetical protein